MKSTVTTVLKSFVYRKSKSRLTCTWRPTYQKSQEHKQIYQKIHFFLTASPLGSPWMLPGFLSTIPRFKASNFFCTLKKSLKSNNSEKQRVNRGLVPIQMTFRFRKLKSNQFYKPEGA